MVSNAIGTRVRKEKRMAGNSTMELNMDRAGLSGWLRDLATGLDTGGVLPGGEAIALEGFKNLKLSMKPNPDGTVRVKLSAKYPKPACACGATPGEAGPGEASA